MQKAVRSFALVAGLTAFLLGSAASIASAADNANVAGLWHLVSTIEGRALPGTESEFLLVKGVGPGRWQKYGPRVLAITGLAVRAEKPAAAPRLPARSAPIRIRTARASCAAR